MNTHALIDAIEVIAPARHAASWDNVGLLIGSQEWPASNITLTIDLTESVLEEAIQSGTNAIIAYHPPVFAPLKAITDRTPKQRIVLECIRNNIAVISPHTALDAAPGGVNDWLADGLGDGDVRALTPASHLPDTEQNKIITFCPADSVETIRNALAAVGAGRIGDYSLCSFESPGTGTFLGGEATSPAVGRAGELEQTPEVRLEMVCPTDSLALAVTTLTQTHPYEEPPVEIHPLAPRPLRGTGEGRRIVLDKSVSIDTLAARLKKRLGVPSVQIGISEDTPRSIDTIGLCVGAGGSLLGDAISQGCQAFITGEMRHHDVLEAQAGGCSVLLAGHTNTERGYLPVLADRLKAALPDATINVSTRDADPLTLK